MLFAKKKGRRIRTHRNLFWRLPSHALYDVLWHFGKKTKNVLVINVRNTTSKSRGTKQSPIPKTEDIQQWPLKTLFTCVFLSVFTSQCCVKVRSFPAMSNIAHLLFSLFWFKKFKQFWKFQILKNSKCLTFRKAWISPVWISRWIALVSISLLSCSLNQCNPMTLITKFLFHNFRNMRKQNWHVALHNAKDIFCTRLYLV